MVAAALHVEHEATIVFLSEALHLCLELKGQSEVGDVRLEVGRDVVLAGVRIGGPGKSQARQGAESRGREQPQGIPPARNHCEARSVAWASSNCPECEGKSSIVDQR